MRLATRLAILSGSALLAILLAAGVFTWQVSRISDLYAQRYEARDAQNEAIAIDRDLYGLLATINRLLLVKDPVERARLNTRLDRLGETIDAELLRAVEDTRGYGNSRQYEPLLAAWNTFQMSYETELVNVGTTGDADALEARLDAQAVRLTNQIAQIVADTEPIVERASQRAEEAIRTSLIVIWMSAITLVAGVGALLFLTSRNIYRTVTASANESEQARRAVEVQASLMTEIQRETDVASAGGIIVSRAAQATGATHGALYLREQGDDPRFALIASYAFHRRKDIPTSFGLGDGLVGQCALEGNRIEVTGAPADYVEIVSGLGKTQPVSLILVPILFESEVLGVLELAGLTPFSDDDTQLLDSLALGTGVAISAIESGQRTRELLSVSQAQTEELQAQEEELRAANDQLVQRENLLSTQNAELEETTEELRSQREALRTSSEQLEKQAESLERKNQELHRLSGSLEAKAEELAVSSRYKSEFLANMSHELRTPLNSILILAGLLREQDDHPITAQQREFAETIEQSGRDLLDLIDEVLDLAKVESGSLRVERETIDTARLVSFLERTFRPVAEAKGVAFRVVVDDSAPRQFVSDDTRVKQIVKNLVSNALKFTDQGSVTVEFSAVDAVTPGGRQLIIAVIDTGIGIDHKDHNLVFEPFQQADQGTTRQYGGTGLGLSISRELARNLGGDITVTSSLGQGSTFRCSLPVGSLPVGSLPVGSLPVGSPPVGSLPTGENQPTAAPDQRAPARPSATGAATGTGSAPAVAQATDDGPRTRFDEVDISGVDWPSGSDPVLLIVEDDPTFAGMLADLATEAGFNSVVTPSGRSALALARAHQPSAITLDIGLPDMAGWVVLDALKHDLATRHIPVSVISGSDDDGRGRRMGAIHTLRKPADAAVLRAMLTATVDFLKPGSRRVLIVDDDIQQRTATAKLIASEDVSVTGVGTGRELLAELAGSTGYDCLVLDLGLPDIDGIDLIEQIQDQVRQKRLPVIVHTGRELTPAETERLEVLASAIVLKNAKSPERLLDETALFLHRVADDMPDATRAMLSDPRRMDEALDGFTVLLVDDDVRNVFSLGSALKRYGITVIPARNGQEGIDALTAHPEVDLVLMDIMMPVMDGYEAMRRIRGELRWHNLPVVALTAKAMKGDRQKCLEAGASDYVTKPVDMDQLTSVLRVWLAHRPRRPRGAADGG